MVKSLVTFEFGAWQESTSKGGKAPTTTKWIDRVKKDDDGRESVRCRVVAREVKPRREDPKYDFVRGDATAGGKGSTVCILCRVHEKRRKTGSGRSEIRVHRRKKNTLQREMWSMLS